MQWETVVGGKINNCFAWGRRTAEAVLAKVFHHYVSSPAMYQRTSEIPNRLCHLSFTKSYMPFQFPSLPSLEIDEDVAEAWGQGPFQVAKAKVKGR